MSQRTRVTETYQPRPGAERTERTFSPRGSGKVPTSVPPLPSGVAPASPPASPPPAATSPSQNGNGASSQGGK